jgi:hypothetical protein
MTRSDQINELAAALAVAQGQIKGAIKDSANPYFKSKYADLASVWDACRQPLSANGLSVWQSPSLMPPPNEHAPWVVLVETMLMHTSGQWISGVASTPIEKMDAQGVGSATTYLRRYALSAFVGVAPEDDDGNAAVGPGPLKTKTSFTKASDIQPKGYQSWLDDLTVVADEGTAALEDAWRKSPVEHRAYLKASSAETIDKLKAKAQRAAVAQ